MVSGAGEIANDAIRPLSLVLSRSAPVQALSSGLSLVVRARHTMSATSATG